MRCDSCLLCVRFSFPWKTWLEDRRGETSRNVLLLFPLLSVVQDSSPVSAVGDTAGRWLRCSFRPLSLEPFSELGYVPSMTACATLLRATAWSCKRHPVLPATPGLASKRRAGRLPLLPPLRTNRARSAAVQPGMAPRLCPACPGGPRAAVAAALVVRVRAASQGALSPCQCGCVRGAQPELRRLARHRLRPKRRFQVRRRHIPRCWVGSVWPSEGATAVGEQTVWCLVIKSLMGSAWRFFREGKLHRRGSWRLGSHVG